MGNDILEGILKLVHTNLLILLLKYMTQVTEKCIHNAGVGGSSPPVATTSFSVKSISYDFPRYVAILITSLVRDFCGTWYRSSLLTALRGVGITGVNQLLE